MSYITGTNMPGGFQNAAADQTASPPGASRLPAEFFKAQAAAAGALDA